MPTICLSVLSRLHTLDYSALVPQLKPHIQTHLRDTSPYETMASKSYLIILCCLALHHSVRCAELASSNVPEADNIDEPEFGKNPEPAELVNTPDEQPPLTSSEPEYAVDLETTSGTHLIFPFFGDVKSIDPELRAFLEDDLTLMLDYLGDFVVSHLERETSPGILRLARAAKDMLLMGKRQEARRRKLNKTVGFRGQFNSVMSDMFGQMLKVSNAYAKELKGTPKDYHGLSRDVQLYIKNLKEAVHESPTAVYVDFANSTVDGENFIQATGRAMGRLRHHGYAGIFDGVSVLLKFLSSVSR